MTNYVQSIRKFIGSERLFIPGVRAILVNHQGEILLQRRTDVPLWGLPAGSVELDETALEALHREVKEETGLDIVTAEPMGLYCGPTQKFTYSNGDRIQCFSLAFIVRQWSGIPLPDGKEGTDLRFFSLSKIPKDMVPTHQETLMDYFRYNGTFMVK